MNSIRNRLQLVRERIAQAARRYGRPTDSIRLLAVSKTRPAADIRAALAAGQNEFGESYLQEALIKIQELQDCEAQWHFIGRIQSNKTGEIARHFDWVHGLASIKHARRLNEQRPEGLPPLNVCIQVNLSQEESKAGLPAEQVEALLEQLRELDRLRVRGLMTLPAPTEELEQQRVPFRALRELRDRLATPQCPLETLSMGMSDDLEAAIAEGATMVRIGTAIFGPR